MKIFLDLDGTIIDARMRIYMLYCDLLPNTFKPLSFNKYWSLKRNKKSNESILTEQGLSKSSIVEFQNIWMKKIETEEYLSYDRLFDFTIPTLKLLKKTSTLYLITARQNRKGLLLELSRLGLKHFFSRIINTKNSAKDIAIAKSLRTDPCNSLFVGDTGEDIIAGKKIDFKTIAVLSGNRNRKVLKAYNPDKILKNISDLKAIHDYETRE